MSKLDNSYMTLVQTTGSSEWWGDGVWHHPWLIRNVLCPDGRYRTAYLGQDADTFFSWPARVKIQKQWLKGCVMAKTEGDLQSGAAICMEFFADRKE